MHYWCGLKANTKEQFEQCIIGLARKTARLDLNKERYIPRREHRTVLTYIPCRHLLMYRFDLLVTHVDDD